MEQIKLTPAKPELGENRPGNLIHIVSPDGMPSLLCGMTHWGEDVSFYQTAKEAIDNFMHTHKNAQIFSGGVAPDELYKSTDTRDDTLAAATKFLLEGINQKAQEFQTRHLDLPLQDKYAELYSQNDVTFGDFMQEMYRLVEKISLQNGTDQTKFISDLSQYIRLSARLDAASKNIINATFSRKSIQLYKDILDNSIIVLRNNNLLEEISETLTPTVFIYGENHFDDVLPILLGQGYQVEFN